MRFLFSSLAFGLLLAAAGAQPAQAQREVRHLNALAYQMGTTNDGTFGQLGYARYLTDKTRLEVRTLVEAGPRAGAAPDAISQAYRGYELGLALAPRLLHLGEVVYVHVPLELRTRYERRPPVGGLPDADGFSFGPSVGFAADVYLLDRLSVTAEARQGWLLLGSVERRLPRYFGAGLAFHLGM